MDVTESLAHTRWECKYHVVWCQPKIEMSYAYQNRSVRF